MKTSIDQESLKSYNFECYFKNPNTLQNGWTIKFPTVFAYSRNEAKEILKSIPFFDCIILFNYEIDCDLMELNMYSMGTRYCFYKHIYNRSEKGIERYQMIKN